MMRSLLHSLIRFLFRSLCRLCIEGIENVPEEGPAILATNHLSRLDSPLIFSMLDRKDLTALVADKYQRHFFFNWLINSLQGIWINREQADLGALRRALEHLERGGILGIAPEGTRSKTGALMEAKTGAAYLVERSRVPVIPVAIWGTESAVRELLHFRRPDLNICFGTSFHLPPLERGSRSLGLKRNADEIMCRIAIMLPPVYRGIYADHPRLRELNQPFAPQLPRGMGRRAV